MFDPKKLKFFLDSLEVEIHHPSEVPKNIGEPERSALDRKMDKYDIFRQGNYQNVSTSEFPIYRKPIVDLFSGGTMMQMPIQFMSAWATYGGIQRSSFPIQGFDYTPDAHAVPVETPHQKFVKTVAQLQTIESAKIADPNPAPLTTSRSPDFVGTITAWRGWAVDDEGKLEALGSDFTWEPKIAAKAKCRSTSTHPAPQMDCNCGFWSFKTIDQVIEAMKGYVTDVKVIGSVEIWGRVIECENGFRSEYAYPKELWLLKDDLEFLSWSYGVPVRCMEKEPPK